MGETLGKEVQALQRICHYVWSGFYSSQDIEQICQYTFEFGKTGMDWVRACIDQQFADKFEQQLEWPEKTDCDRLDEAFAALEKFCIIALQKAGDTQSQGMEIVSGLWRDLGGEHSQVVGYCFYHAQDLERVMKGDALHLTFGDIHGDEAKGVSIGMLLCRVFKQHGFAVVWDEDVKTRVQICGIDWKRRTREY
jgi:hypothetical protein